MEAKTITVQRTKTIPFDFDLAVAISRGEKEGEIIFRGEEEGEAIIAHVSNMDECHPLLIVVQNRVTEFSAWFNKKGERSGYPKDKLYIRFHKEEIFKDGDILVGIDGFMFMLNTDGPYKTSMHAGVYPSEAITFTGATKLDEIEIFRKADENEYHRFVSILKKSDDDRAIKLLKKYFGIDKEISFKSFDKVLIKDNEEDKWEASLYVRKKGDLHECLLGLKYKYCIPFEGNEHLLENE